MNPNPYETPTQATNNEHNAPVRFAMSAFAIVVLASIAFASIAPAVATFAGAPHEFIASIFRISILACVPFGCAVAIASYLTMRCRWRTSQLTWFFLSMVIVVPIAMHPRYAGPLVGYTGFAIGATISTAIFAVWLIRRLGPQSLRMTPDGG